MGNRVFVSLHIPTELVERAEKVIGGWDGKNATDWEGAHGITYYEFSEVINGDLKFLQKLREMGIPYSSIWDGNADFGSGTEFCRFTPEGELVFSTIYDSERTIPVSELMTLIDDPVGLKKRIAYQHDLLQVIPWDNQVTYGKYHFAKRLINAIE